MVSHREKKRGNVVIKAENKNNLGTRRTARYL